MERGDRYAQWHEILPLEVLITPATGKRKAGVVNKDYQAQKALLATLDKGEIQLADV